MKSRHGIIPPFATLLLFVILEALSVVMITNDSVIQRYGIMDSIRDVQSFFWSSKVRFKQFLSYREENERLWDENVSLKQQLENLRSAAARVDSGAFAAGPDFTYLRANVIKNFTNRQHNYLIINKGFKDGVSQGMGVVTDRGVIGIVNACSRNYSQVISFLNIEQSISAKISKSGEFGPMMWSGTSTATAVIREIPIHSEVAPGDSIVSSGYSSIYPAGIPIGTVDHTEEVNGVSQNLYVTLFENFRALDRVYIVRSNIAGEINNLIEGDEK